MRWSRAVEELPALLAVAAILLVVLGLVIGMAVARMVAEDERRKAAVAIYRAVYEEIALALAAYGGATVPAAAKLAVVVRMALGPVLTLAGSLGGPLKQIDTAVKGKTKDKPAGGAHASGGGAPSRPPPAARSATADHHQRGDRRRSRRGGQRRVVFLGPQRRRARHDRGRATRTRRATASRPSPPSGFNATSFPDPGGGRGPAASQGPAALLSFSSSASSQR